jgi:hypothetical protein
MTMLNRQATIHSSSVWCQAYSFFAKAWRIIWEENCFHSVITYTEFAFCNATLLPATGFKPFERYILYVSQSIRSPGSIYKEIMRQRLQNKQTPWSESASELYRPSDRRLSAKRLPNCADRGCHVVSVTDPSGRILGFIDRSRYFSIK